MVIIKINLNWWCNFQYSRSPESPKRFKRWPRLNLAHLWHSSRNTRHHLSTESCLHTESQARATFCSSQMHVVYREAWPQRETCVWQTLWKLIPLALGKRHRDGGDIRDRYIFKTFQRLHITLYIERTFLSDILEPQVPYNKGNMDLCLHIKGESRPKFMLLSCQYIWKPKSILVLTDTRHWDGYTQLNNAFFFSFFFVPWSTTA